MNELEFISKLLKPLAGEFSLNLSDDIGLIDNSKKLAFSTDTICENIHFLENTEPFKIAIKLLSVNISDLVAKGVTPLYYSLNTSFSEKIDQKWLEDFCAGLKYMQDKYNIHLIGGDTTKAESLVLSATIFGSYKEKPIPINGANIGDIIFCSGFIGDSYLGLHNQNNKYLKERYEIPNPRVEFINKLANYASASTDISDGLIVDLKKILKNSDKGAILNLENIPFSDEGKKFLNLRDKMISISDDYEILFTSSNKEMINSLAKELNFSITEIGIITEKKGLICKDKNKEVIINEEGFCYNFAP